MKLLKNILINRKKTIWKSMNHRKLLSHLPFFCFLMLMGTPVLLSCEDDDQVTEVQCPEVQHVDNFRQPGTAMSFLPSSERKQLLPYVGRDSFGIALDASVEGIRESVSAGGDSSLVEITGSGQSALLGEIEVSQAHFVNHSSHEISEGRFTFKAEDGELISGTYKGSRTPVGEGFTVNLLAKVSGGNVDCTPTNLESGWGWVDGSLTHNRLDYQIDGWLFHHTEVDE